VKIKRIVRINSYGVGGCSLTVTFKGVAYRDGSTVDSPAPRIDVEWSSMSGDDKELRISSRYMKDAIEAAKWIAELTDEVKEVANIGVKFRQDFEALEGETEIK
jgi:hypothetical protein